MFQVIKIPTNVANKMHTANSIIYLAVIIFALSSSEYLSYWYQYVNTSDYLYSKPYPAYDISLLLSIEIHTILQFPSLTGIILCFLISLFSFSLALVYFSSFFFTYSHLFCFGLLKLHRRFENCLCQVAFLRPVVISTS